MNGSILETIWNLQQRTTEEEDSGNEEIEFSVVYGNLTEDEIMQELKQMSVRIAELNREIRVGVDAIKMKMAIKEEMKKVMKQYIKEC